MPGLDVTGSGGFGGRLRVNRRWNIGHRSYLQRDDACLREPHAVVRGALARPGEFLLAFPLGALVREVVGESLELLPQPVGLELRLPQALSLPRGHGVGPVGEPAANAVEGCGRWGVGCEPRGLRCFKNLPALGSSERADKKRSSHHTAAREATRRHRLSVTCKPRICTRAFRDGRHRASRTHTIAARVGRTRRRRQLRRPRIRTRRQPANRSSSSEPVGVDSPPPSHCARLDAR